jgi:hypothetical protein
MGAQYKIDNRIQIKIDLMDAELKTRKTWTPTHYHRIYRQCTTLVSLLEKKFTQVMGVDMVDCARMIHEDIFYGDLRFFTIYMHAVLKIRYIEQQLKHHQKFGYFS